MPFIKQLLQIKSLSIVGTAKNTGKTATLNYILQRLHKEYPLLTIGLTSIGLEGEKRDQVTQTDKPEITLYSGSLFVTAEHYYLQKRLSAEVIDIERHFTTSTGSLIYARAKGKGKVLIAGPPTSQGLVKAIEVMHRNGTNLAIIDGAFSRLSLASPAVAEGTVLATGAAYSAQPELLIQRTKELVELMKLPTLQDSKIVDQLDQIDNGVRLISDDSEIVNPNFGSALLPQLWETPKWKGFEGYLYVPGVIHDNLLDKIGQTKSYQGVIVKDFTRFFVSGQKWRQFLSRGKKAYCLKQAKLLAVTFNPLAPNGFRMNSEEMCGRLSEALQVPVYDIMKQNETVS